MKPFQFSIQFQVFISILIQYIQVGFAIIPITISPKDAALNAPFWFSTVRHMLIIPPYTPLWIDYQTISRTISRNGRNFFSRGMLVRASPIRETITRPLMIWAPK